MPKSRLAWIRSHSRSRRSYISTLHEGFPAAPLPPLDSLGPRTRPWLTIGALIAASVLSLLDRISLSLMVPAIQADLHLSDVQISLLLGLAFSAFYGVAALPVGWLVDRTDRRVVVGAGIALWSVMTAGCGMAGSFGHLFLARAGVGVGEATLQPASQSIIADITPKQDLPWAMTIFGTGAMLGAALAFALGGAIIGAVSALPPLVIPGFGALAAWQTSFLALGLPGLAAAPIIALCIREPRITGASRQRISDKPADLGPFLRAHATLFVLILGGVGLLIASSAASAAWLPKYFLQAFGWKAGASGLALGAAVLFGTTPGALTLGWLARAWTSKGRADAALRVMVLAHLAAAPFVFLPFLMPGPLGFFLVMTPAFVLGAAYVGLGATAVQAMTPQPFRGRVAAVYLIATGVVGISAGPFFVAALTEKLFADEAYLGLSIGLTSLVCTAVAVLLLAMAGPGYRRAMAAQNERLGEQTPAEAGCPSRLT